MFTDFFLSLFLPQRATSFEVAFEAAKAEAVEERRRLLAYRTAAAALAQELASSGPAASPETMRATSGKPGIANGSPLAGGAPPPPQRASPATPKAGAGQPASPNGRPAVAKPSFVNGKEPPVAFKVPPAAKPAGTDSPAKAKAAADLKASPFKGVGAPKAGAAAGATPAPGMSAAAAAAAAALAATAIEG